MKSANISHCRYCCITRLCSLLSQRLLSQAEDAYYLMLGAYYLMQDAYYLMQDAYYLKQKTLIISCWALIISCKTLIISCRTLIISSRKRLLSQAENAYYLSEPAEASGTPLVTFESPCDVLHFLNKITSWAVTYAEKWTKQNKLTKFTFCVFSPDTLMRQVFTHYAFSRKLLTTVI